MRKEIYCEKCRSDQPMLEVDPQEDDLNPYPWYDIVCGTCDWIIATVRIVPDDKPLEQPAARTLTEERRGPLKRCLNEISRPQSAPATRDAIELWTARSSR
jgi:hypothetical protein